ncbi:MAG: thiamine-binding protein [Eubacterium sp.]|nr:thiamine-binding protein [Eubacterium sp.]
MNASVAIQVLPKAKDDEELIRIVDAVIDYIRSTGLNYYVGPCETAIEGDYEELMEIVKNCQLIAVEAGAPSVLSYVKIDFRPEGQVLTIERKTSKHHKNDYAKHSVA